MELIKKGFKIYGILVLISLAITGVLHYVAGIIRIKRAMGRKDPDFDEVLDESMRIGFMDLFAAKD